MTTSAVAAEATADVVPQLIIDAAQNEGVYSPNVMGDRSVTVKDVPKLLDQYVHYYNYERPAAALGYKSPVQYKTELGF